MNMSNHLLDLSNPYPTTDREKSRRTYKRLAELALEAKYAAERGIVLSAESEEIVSVLTKTSDMSIRATALQELADDIRRRHLERLLKLAPNEFAAFCEYVSPDEPPESAWHQYLTGELQAIEYDPDRHRVILNCPPGHAKPLHVNTPVLMGDGAWKRLGDVTVGDKVITHTGKARKVTAVHEQGTQPILRITTAKGRVVLSAPDHSFWTEGADGYKDYAEGWKQAIDLRPGDKLKIVERPGELPHGSMSDGAEAHLAAIIQTRGAMSWMRGRSGTGAYRSFYLYAVDEATAREFQKPIQALGISHTCRPLSTQKGWVIRFKTSASNDLAERFRLDDRKETRRVPTFIMGGTTQDKKQYLTTLFNLIGESCAKFGGRWLYIYSKSPDFLADVQKLLGWFDIETYLDREPKPLKGGGVPRLIVRGEALDDFLDVIPYRGKYLDRIVAAAPYDPNRAPKRMRSARADQDEITSVEMDAPAECRCLTVEGDHTFSANGIIVHNSTYASRLFVAWRLGRDPNHRIIGGGHSQTFVENEFSKKIRDLVNSPAYKEVFPTIVISQHTRGATQWNIAGTKGQYVARGVGQGVHGFRATFIVVDDPYSKIEDAESPTIREKVNTWFTTDIGSRVLPGGKVFVIMTRFHEHDLTGHLMEMNKNLPERDRWQLIEAPAICYDEDRDIMSRRLGDVLWDYYDLSYFVTKKAELTYSRFALIYQQLTDASSEGSICGHFKYYQRLPHQEPEVIAAARDAGKVDPGSGKVLIDRKDYFRRVVLSVDTASKPTERADYTVIQVWGETHDRKHYLFSQKRLKVDFNKMIEAIESTAIRYGVDAILVEDKGQGTAYIQARGQTDYQKRVAPAPIIPIQVPSNQGKEFRFDEVCPMIEAGDVYLPERADFLDKLIVEVGQFPGGAHDDQVDAMSQYLRWAKSTRSRFGSRKVGSMG